MKIVKWLGFGLAGLLAVLVATLVGTRIVSESKLGARFEVRPFAAPALPDDEAALAEGRRLFAARGCAECHGEDGGGRTVIDDPVLGRVAGANITRGKGGLAAGFGDADFVRAVRHCVKPDGSAVRMMPCIETRLVPDAELAAILAHVKRLPPVDREITAIELRPVGHALHAFGVLDLVHAAQIDFDAPIPAAPEPAPTAAYGERLAQIQCIGCHGEGLSGGPLPGAPPGLPVPSNITPDDATGIGQWSQQHFVQLLRTGRRPDGTAVDPFMPWQTYRHMNETEIAALWAYLRSRPARPFGNR